MKEAALNVIKANLVQEAKPVKAVLVPCNNEAKSGRA
jgi:hypothetical protein